MGLAPYGEPRYTDVIMKHLIDVKGDGRFASISAISTIAPA
jgi:carbamoyltransferase